MGKNEPKAIKKIAAKFVNTKDKDRKRHPRGHRHCPQEIYRAIEQILHRGVPTDEYSQNNPGYGCEGKPDGNSLQAHEGVGAPSA